ncbi:MAG: DUF1919 domain-containing protein [Planctomycetota bacterium]
MVERRAGASNHGLFRNAAKRFWTKGFRVAAGYQEAQFLRRLQQCQRRDFCIIARNCLGGLPYQLLKIPYRTPTVGLFFRAKDYLRFASDLPRYLSTKLSFDTSHQAYPLGQIDDVEIHFLHYASEREAYEKWTRRVQRVDLSKVALIHTDREGVTQADLEAFEQLPYARKVCFTAKPNPLASCVQITAYRDEPMVGDLYTNYRLFGRDFHFGHWLDSE